MKKLLSIALVAAVSMSVFAAEGDGDAAKKAQSPEPARAQAEERYDSPTWPAFLAIAIVPRRFLSPFIDSIRIGARVSFWFMSRVKPPPWIMNPSITRWKIVPS